MQRDHRKLFAADIYLFAHKEMIQRIITIILSEFYIIIEYSHIIIYIYIYLTNDFPYRRFYLLLK